MPSTNHLRTRLIEKLKELFQLNQPDLDFGFYRIMHAKAEQVTRFLEDDLLKHIADTFEKESVATAQTTLADAQRKVRETLGDEAVNADGTIQQQYEGTKIGKEYLHIREALARAVEETTIEGEIYDHLYRFFSRYYEDGDFVSLRYYAPETAGRAAPYVIPYNGEEVKLHWANADQYYVKTSEYFNHFTFDLATGAREQLAKNRKQGKSHQEQELDLGEAIPDKPLRVHFRIVEAQEGEHNNVKTTDDNKRFFLLHKPQPVMVEATGELTVQFEYRADSDKAGQAGKWQEAKNSETVSAILQALETLPEAVSFLPLLTLPAPTPSDKSRKLLAKYIAQYAARNTSDYFIHKNLGDFLRRELDFYLKNEVMRLDDVVNMGQSDYTRYIRKLGTLRTIAGQLIDFLAQLEDFQKKLWLKKKFVVETNYCITLDRVPEALYPEIVANATQWQEWKALGFLDISHEKAQKGSGQEELVLGDQDIPKTETVAYLKAFPCLVLATRFFDESFKARLIAAIDNFDDQCDGLLIHSENFQALNLLQERYREQIKCITIDPPYNRLGDGFPYKDNYQHASWLSLMNDRLLTAFRFLRIDGALFSNIDENERDSLQAVLNLVFGFENRVEELIWAQNTTHSQSPLYSTNHEYVEVYAANKTVAERDPTMFREPKPGYVEIMELVKTLKPNYPSYFQIEKTISDLFKTHIEDYKTELRELGLTFDEETKKQDPWRGLYAYNNPEYRDDGGKILTETEAAQRKAHLYLYQPADASAPAQKQSDSTRDPNNANYRFYRPNHPKTGQPCEHPKTGWRWPYSWPDPNRDSFQALDGADRIAWGADHNTIPRFKRFLHEVETNVSRSVFHDYSDGEKQIASLFGLAGVFPTPKPTTLPARFISQTCGKNALIMDFFGGSGSTAHAVINLNREDGGKRKYILVEMGDHFDTVLKPRIAKVVYSKDWKDGKPTSRDTGISHCFKVLRLESYEDTLNNLTVALPPESQRKELAQCATLREEYMLHYLLDVETQDSPSLLNLSAFAEPTAYTLRIKRPGSDEYEDRAVDLLETFNYLIGLRVEHLDAPQTVDGVFTREKDPALPDDTHTRLTAQLRPSPDGAWHFRKVEGWVPSNRLHPDTGGREKVLIVWRNLTDDIEKDNALLDAWFQKNRINTRDFEFDTIYVNGSNNLPNLRRDGDRWKVVLTEEEFTRRMWETE